MIPTATDRHEPRTALIRVLGPTDLVLMNVVSVVSLRWIARGARAGPSSLVLWGLAALLFLLPFAVALIVLGRRHPEEGGVYAWTRRAFGPTHGFFCGWCLWVNNLFYLPSLLLFGAANAVLMFGDRFEPLIESRSYAVGFVLAGLWACVWVNILGLKVGRWIQNIGSLGAWIPTALLIAAAVTAVRSVGSATSLAGRDLLPRGDAFATIGLWSSMCFAFSGFEIGPSMAEEIRRPERTIPVGIGVAAILTAVVYLAGSTALLVALPEAERSERSSIVDAVQAAARRAGIGAGLDDAVAGLILASTLACTSAWTAGAARVPFTAGLDRVMPRAFGRMHSRFLTPHVALIVQGIAASAVFLASVFISAAGRSTSVQDAYDILVNLTILLYFVPYLYLFLALPRLMERFGPRWRMSAVRVAALVGASATMVSLLLVFVPPPGTQSIWNYEVNVIVQSAFVLAIGAALYRFSRVPRTP